MLKTAAHAPKTAGSTGVTAGPCGRPQVPGKGNTDNWYIPASRQVQPHLIQSLPLRHRGFSSRDPLLRAALALQRASSVIHVL